MGDGKKDEKKIWAAYSTIGMMFPASIAVGLFIGYFLDKRLHTSPYLLIVFTLIGVAAGFWNLVKITGLNEKRKKR